MATQQNKTANQDRKVQEQHLEAIQFYSKNGAGVLLETLALMIEKKKPIVLFSDRSIGKVFGCTLKDMEMDVFSKDHKKLIKKNIKRCLIIADVNMEKQRYNLYGMNVDLDKKTGEVNFCAVYQLTA